MIPASSEGGKDLAIDIQVDPDVRWVSKLVDIFTGLDADPFTVFDVCADGGWCQFVDADNYVFLG